jgi:heme-degrading monooxygenase HmoA
MYIAIRRYRLSVGSSAAELLRQVNEGFIPIIKEAPGFLAYYVLDSGNDTVASVSVFEDRAGAEESNRRAEEWVGQNLSRMISTSPDITSGEVGAYELNLAQLGIREVRE